MNKCGKGKYYKEEMKETTHLSLRLFLYLPSYLEYILNWKWHRKLKGVINRENFLIPAECYAN
jgi:hypothetical protein